MARAGVWTVAAAALLLGACGSAEPRPVPASAPSPAPRSGCPGGGRTDVEGGVLRMPTGARAGETPLIVVVIPGDGGAAGDGLRIPDAANRRGFAVLYPIGSGVWTLNDAQGSRDVDAVGALLERTVATGCFDPARISITGVSNGAGFAARMGCELPGRFAAVVPVGAGYRALDRCPAIARSSFLAIHGTADTVVPYNGKRPDRKGSVPRFTAAWARRAGCTGRRTTTPRRLVTRFVWRGCADGVRVELLRLTGTAHGWPGEISPFGRTANPSGVRATVELLRFVAGARRR